MRGETHPHPRTTRRFAAAAALLLATLALAGGCRKPAPGAPETRVDEPNADSVDLVVFLIGDAGEALPGTSPVLARLQREIEAWSGGLGRDSAVSVLFLGDNVYPVGIREPSHPEHAVDTLRLRGQLDVVAGPNARRYRATSYLMAGNHDWGNMIGAAGLQRLTNQQDKIEAARSAGLLVKLVPTAGQPGPTVIDYGRQLRMVILDTHWWLQAPSGPAKRDVLDQVEQALRTAGGRHVMVAAHHPFRSGGAHGGPMPVWEGLGILWLLRQTGSLVQDLNASVYKELLNGLKEIFGRVDRPLIFAGGHDHSLQVVEDVELDEPQWSIVSGAGSKTTEVTYVGGMTFADDLSGFMRLAFMRDGTVLLHVIAAPAEHRICGPALDGELAACMQAGVDAFRSVYSVRLN